MRSPLTSAFRRVQRWHKPSPGSEASLSVDLSWVIGSFARDCRSDFRGTDTQLRNGGSG
jgi:hypothetical protein